MAQLIFLFWGDFCRSTATFRKIEDRIITKAILPFYLIADDAFHCPPALQNLSIRQSTGYGTDEAGSPLFIRNACKLVYQSFIFYIIRRILTHKSCRINPRCSVQIIYLQSGVICHNDFSCHFHNSFCFDGGIFCKAFPVFFNISRYACFFHRKDRHAQIFQYHADFPHFSFISRCKDYSFFHLSMLLVLYSSSGYLQSASLLAHN